MGDLIRAVWAKVRALCSRTRLDDDFNEELAAHVELLAAENEKAGMTPEEARRAAMVRIGGRESLREQNRDARGLPFLEVLQQDFALRRTHLAARLWLCDFCHSHCGAWRRGELHDFQRGEHVADSLAAVSRSRKACLDCES